MEKRESDEEELIFGGESGQRVEFTYEEESDSAETGSPSAEKERSVPLGEGAGQEENPVWPQTRRVWLIVCGILLLAVAVVFLYQKGKEDPDDGKMTQEENGETEQSSDGWEENGIGANVAAGKRYSEYRSELVSWLEQTENVTAVIGENGEYPVGSCIVADLDGDGIFPEAFRVEVTSGSNAEQIGDMQIYSGDVYVICYYYQLQQDGTYAPQQSDLSLDSDFIPENVILNQRQNSYTYDIILTGENRIGERRVSQFYEYLPDGAIWMLGEADGIVDAQYLDVAGTDLQKVQYDMNGVYRVKELFTQNVFSEELWKVTPYRIEEATSSIEEAEFLTVGNRRLIRLEGSQTWCLRRPVLAYVYDGEDWEIAQLEGERFAVTGYLEGYYQIETDQGQQGFIGIENGMVTLQKLPVQEVFSDQVLLRTEDLYAYIGKVLEAEGCYDASESYWVDLNGDSAMEKVRFYDSKGEDGTLTYVYIHDEQIGDVFSAKDGSVSLLLLDLDPSDDFLEIGYTWEQEGAGGRCSRLYRYDGIGAWEVFSSDPYYPMFFTEEGVCRYQDGQVPALSQEGELVYELDLQYDPDMHRLGPGKEPWEARLTEPLSCTAATDLILYTDTTFTSEAGRIYVGDHATVERMAVRTLQGDDRDYSFYLRMDNGTEGYISFNRMEDALGLFGITMSGLPAAEE